MTVKALYPNVEIFYDSFLADKYGAERWNEAYKLFPKFNLGRKDTDLAVDYIIDGMRDWLYNHDPELNDIDIEVYMDTNAQEIYESIYAGLT